MQSISDINFIEHGGRHAKQLGMFMPGRYWVPKIEVTLAWELANANLPELNWTEKVCAETLINPEIWRQFSIQMKFRIGRCLKLFCRHEMLPITVANPGKKGKRFYCKKSLGRPDSYRAQSSTKNLPTQ